MLHDLNRSTFFADFQYPPDLQQDSLFVVVLAQAVVDALSELLAPEDFRHDPSGGNGHGASGGPAAGDGSNKLLRADEIVKVGSLDGPNQKDPKP